jgi:imidazolonepropionase-like amidohydrolase
LRTATSGAAAILGWSKAGRLVQGFWADAILVDGDPTADIGVLADRHRIHAVIKAGVLEVDRRPEA